MTKCDAAIATALLAEAERIRAIEAHENTLLLCSSEHQHFLATLGSSVVSHIETQLAADEREKQATADNMVISRARKEFPPESATALRYADEVVSQELMWNYMRFAKVERDIQNEIQKYRDENDRLKAEIERLKS